MLWTILVVLAIVALVLYIHPPVAAQLRRLG